MSLQRAAVVRGPGHVEVGGVVIHSAGNITAVPTITTTPIPTARFGPTSHERKNTVLWTISFTPAGEWENFAQIWPYTSPTFGASILSGVIVIWGTDGEKLTFSAGGISQMPNVILAADKTLLGPMTILAIGADNEAWSAATHFVTQATASYTDVTLDPSAMIVQPYTVVWGAGAPWSSIETEGGVSLEFAVGTQNRLNDREGIYDILLTSLDVTATLRPQNVTTANMLALLKIQDTGAVRGQSIGAPTNVNDLVISNTGVHATLYNCAPLAAPLNWDMVDERAGVVQFKHVRKYTVGVPSAYFRLATAAA